jgi:crotonobetainyl-CoA:carnitine CoA-transferase CaiB-like acyl-CoA transferase
MSQRIALDALQVIDAGTMTAGPFGVTILADLGADVIKIEEPRAGDPMRDWSPIKDGRTSWWKVTGRNKKLTLDLSVPRGKELFLCQVEATEAVIGNFRPSTFGWPGADELHEASGLLVD